MGYEDPGRQKLREEMGELSVFEDQLDDLFDYYKIGREHPERWKKLSLELAKEFIPAFRFVHKKGRPKKDPVSQIALVKAVLDQIRRGQSVRQACQILVKTKKWPGTKPGTLAKPGTLESTFRKVREKLKGSNLSAKELSSWGLNQESLSELLSDLQFTGARKNSD